MNALPTARDMMSKWFVVLSPDMDIYDAMDILASKRCSGAPVVDRDKNTVGLLTEKDCLRVLSNDTYNPLARGLVGDYMSPINNAISADMELFEVASKFLECNFTFLPVMDDGALVGRISRQDMLKWIIKLQRAVTKARADGERELLKKQHPAGINQLQEIVNEHKPEHVAALFRSMHSD